MDLTQLELDENFYDKLYATMNVFDEEKFKKALIAIARISSDVVGSTVGPFARTVIIGDGYTHYPSKDGWSVLKKLSFNTAVYQELFGIFKDVSYTLASKVGDGTSTAVIAANEFIKEMTSGDCCDKIAMYRQSQVTKTLEQLVDELSEILNDDSMKHSIDKSGHFDDLKRVAMISSNGNEELSEIIRKIYDETRNPNIYVAFGNSDKLEYTIEQGYKLAGETIALRAYVNNDEGTYKINKPIAIAVVDHNITWGDHSDMLAALAQLASNRRQNLLLIAPTYDDITATSLKATIDKFMAAGQEPSLCVFTAPIGMNHMKKSLEDFATLVGAHVIDYTRVTAFNRRMYEESGGSMENVKFKETVYDELEDYKSLNALQLLDQCLGTSTNTVIGDKYIIIKDYDTDRDIVRVMMAEAKEEYETLKKKVEKAVAANDTEYMRAAARYNRLSGSMGTILVGADSDLSQRCLKDSVDDAVLACKSAYDNGYVKGLNIDCLRAINKLMSEKYSDSNSLEFTILEILYQSILAASLKVMENKYGDPTSPIPELPGAMDSYDVITKCVSENLVLNLVTDEFEDDDNTVVIQSVRTDIEVLKALSSILTLILTSSHMISTNQLYDRDALEEIEGHEKMNRFKEKLEIAFDMYNKSLRYQPRMVFDSMEDVF